MKRSRKALSALPLLLVFGCASTQQTGGTASGIFEIPDRGRPFADRAREAAELTELHRPTPSDQRYEVPQRGIPFAEEQEQKLKAQWNNLPGHVYSEKYADEVGTLLAVPRIVADESAVQFFGFGLTPEERETFDKARAQRIDGRVNRRTLKEMASAPMGPRDKLGCVMTLPLCPLALGVGLGVAWVGERTLGRLSATIQEPRLIPEADGSRLATVFRERLTSTSLHERTTRLAASGSRTAADEDAPATRLTVRFTAVTLNYAGRHLGLTLAAEAQASPSAGNNWPPSRHVYRSPARPLSAWTADSDALVLREIENALEALASNIWEVYSPRQSKAVASQLPGNVALESTQSGSDQNK